MLLSDPSLLSRVFDTHAHLSMLDKRKIPSVEKVKELFSGGFSGIIDIGTEAGDLSRRIAVYGGFKRIWFSAGIWPSKEAIENRLEMLRLLKAEIGKAPPGKLVAIGECGLDRHWNNAESGVNPRDEAELFALQLELAEELKLPVIVHSRDAPEDTLALLKDFPGLTAIIHCYSYGPGEVERFLDLGCYVSFAGTVTYRNSGKIRESLLACSRDKILFETDCPYLAPEPYRGKTADPGMTAVTYRFAADKLGMETDALKTMLLANVARAFGIGVS